MYGGIFVNKKHIKHSFCKFLDAFGLNFLFGKLTCYRLKIFYYHGICSDRFSLEKGYTDRHMRVSVFEKQLKYLKEKGFNFLNMSEAVTALKKNKISKNSVVLTFDDGFRNVLQNAYPLLKKYNARACIYVVTSNSITGVPIWTDVVEAFIRHKFGQTIRVHFENEFVDYRISNFNSASETIKEIKKKLREVDNEIRIKLMKQFEIEASEWIPNELRIAEYKELQGINTDILEIALHTRTHPNCDKLNQKELEDEILGCKRDLEEYLGINSEHFCYPAGAYNEATLQIIEKCGYVSATTIEEGLNNAHSNVFKLKRIFSDEDFLVFKAQLSGIYPFFKNLKKIIKL